MEPCVYFLYLSHLLYGICVNIFIMNRYISKSYTRSKNTIHRAGAAVVSTITSVYFRNLCPSIHKYALSFCFISNKETGPTICAREDVSTCLLLKGLFSIKPNKSNRYKCQSSVITCVTVILLIYLLNLANIK